MRPLIYCLQEQRYEYQCYDAHQLDEDVQSGAGGILERIANGIAGNSSLVSIRALAAVCAAFGGGGHVKAAGCTVICDGGIDAVVELIAEALEAAL